MLSQVYRHAGFFFVLSTFKIFVTKRRTFEFMKQNVKGERKTENSDLMMLKRGDRMRGEGGQK